MANQLDATVKRVLNKTRVGHFASVDEQGVPHVVPICFVLDSNTIYSLIDEKPKESKDSELGRVRNIRSNESASLVVDYYSEDWSQLFWVQLRGTATLTQPESNIHERIVPKLEEKYPQYTEHNLYARLLITLSVETTVSWGKLRPDRLS